MQAMYDLVGDKIARDLRRPGRRHRRSSTSTTSVIHYPYTIERGVRFPDEPMRLDRRFRRAVLETRDAAVVIDDVEAWVARARAAGRDPGRAAEVGPLRAADRRRRAFGRHLAPEPRPRARLQRIRRAPARRRSPRASASPSRTPAWSTRPASGPPSWRSSTRSARPPRAQLDLDPLIELTGEQLADDLPRRHRLRRAARPRHRA